MPRKTYYFFLGIPVPMHPVTKKGFDLFFVMLYFIVLLLSSAAIAFAQPLPKFNQLVIDSLFDYADGGSYEWPEERGTHGTTKNLYLGKRVLAKASKGSHCVGLTFEVFWNAMEKLHKSRLNALNYKSAKGFMRTWFAPALGHQGAEAAIRQYGFGNRVHELSDAQPGDFVQVWTNDNTLGHSMIFLSWIKHNNKIVGIRFWSSQPWTDGISVSELVIGENDSDISINKIFIARVFD